MSTDEKVIELIQINKKENPNQHLGSLRLLILELKRRLTLWKNEISANGITVTESRNILIDVVEAILDVKRKTIDFEKIQKGFPDIRFSYYDKMMLECYFDWENHEDKIRQLGYTSPSPYEPYIELLKRGTRWLIFENGYIEMQIYASTYCAAEPGRPLDLPFYTDLKDLEIADEKGVYVALDIPDPHGI
jgi:hypothetical protein